MGILDNYGKDPNLLKERTEELQGSLQTFDPRESIVFPMSWNGDYIFRAFPCPDPSDWMVPVGMHYGVFPTGNAQKSISSDLCPNFTYHQFCPICAGISKLLAERKATKSEFQDESGKGILVKKRLLFRVLLIKTKLVKGGGAKNPPVWREDDLPAVRILSVPPTVATALSDMVNDEDWGIEKITHPATGLKIKVHVDFSKSGSDMYDTKVLTDLHPLPDELCTDEGIEKYWPNVRDYLLPPNTDELMQKIEKHALDIDPRLYNAIMAIDVGPRQIEAAQGAIDVGDRKPVASLKEQIAKKAKKK